MLIVKLALKNSQKLKNGVIVGMLTGVQRMAAKFWFCIMGVEKKMGPNLELESGTSSL